MVTIYHNPRCAKSRAGLAYLTGKKIDFNSVEYLKQGLTVSQVAELVRYTGLPVTELIRKNDDIFKSTYKGKNFSNDQWCQIIAENPKLLQRPIVVNNTKAVLAQPPEKVDDIL